MRAIPTLYRRTFDWARALWDDVASLYRRARYGWAPRDVLSLDLYLNSVLAGSLEHLAATTHGSPYGYPHLVPHVRAGELMRPWRDGDDPNDVVTDHERWRNDLQRWALAFREAADDGDIFHDESPFATRVSQEAEVKRRSNVLRQAMAEMTPWWEHLWD